MFSETPLREWLEGVLGESVMRLTPVSGGDINRAYRVDCASGAYFVKTSARDTAFDNLTAESQGLELIRNSGTIRVPHVLEVNRLGTGGVLLMEMIETKRPTEQDWSKLGVQLARLHRTTRDQYGLDHSNYIGALPQSNDPRAGWVEFYISQRLEPQWQSACSYFNSQDHTDWDKLISQLTALLVEEQPALIHGDLWGGNIVFDKDGPVLIDPSVSYAHREMDIAMSRLFGGFDNRFYQVYNESYPLEHGIEERIPLYQLYYLLVHVNLFGAGYVRGVQNVVSRYKN